jgi:Polysaccharide deacetylase
VDQRARHEGGRSLRTKIERLTELDRLRRSRSETDSISTVSERKLKDGRESEKAEGPAEKLRVAAETRPAEFPTRMTAFRARRVLALVAVVFASGVMWGSASGFSGFSPSPAADPPGREPYAVPQARLTPEESADWKPIPPYRGIPVLEYHGVTNVKPSPNSVTPSEFALQMAMLRHAGFRTVSLEQFVAWFSGSPVHLPPRPILITFDDGRLDSYRGADQTLARYQDTAVMFVIAQKAYTDPFFLKWSELRAMEASGRWQLQVHADKGHVLIPTNGAGATGPFYANEMVGESFEGYVSRVTHDITSAIGIMREQIPGFRSIAMALPYGSYGQCSTNDPSIPRFLGPWLAAHFALIFTVNPIQYATRSEPRYRIGRRPVTAVTSADDLYRWLASRAPRPAPVNAPACSPSQVAG